MSSAKGLYEKENSQTYIFFYPSHQNQNITDYSSKHNPILELRQDYQTSWKLQEESQYQILSLFF